MLLIYIVIICFLIFSNYKLGKYFFVKEPLFMLFLGSFDIIIAVLLNVGIKALIKTGLTIFKDLVIANYLVNISIAAIGANIIASAIVVGAERAAKNKEKEEIKNLKFLEAQLAYYESIKEEAGSQSPEKMRIIDKIVGTTEKIEAIKKRLGVD